MVKAVFGPLGATIQTVGESKSAGYMATTTSKEQSPSECVADIVCTQNLLISSTAAFVAEYNDLSNFYYTNLDLEQQAQYALPPTVSVFMGAAFASYFGFSIGSDLFALYSLWLKTQQGSQVSITRLMGSDLVLIGGMFVSYWNSTYNVQATGPNSTVFRLIPTSQLALDPKCLPEICKCKLGSCGLVDSFTVTLTGELQEVKLNSISSIFLEISESILKSTLAAYPITGDSPVLETELMLISNTMEQLNVNAVCADCCDKNCVLDFILLTVGDNKNCCSSVCCPDTCTSAGVSISAIPIPVVALPPDCCPPCSGPTSGPCKSHWDQYVSKLDEHGEPCSAHQDDGPGVISPSKHTAHDGAHSHVIPDFRGVGIDGATYNVPGTEGSTGRYWTGVDIHGNGVLSPQVDDGTHSHAITNPDGTAKDRHATPAEYVHDILNSCLSKCCTFYFASKEGVFMQMGETMWSNTAMEGTLNYASTHTKSKHPVGGTHQVRLGLMTWLLAAVQGLEIHPKAKTTPEQLARDLQGLHVKPTGLSLPFGATSTTPLYISNKI